MCIRSFRNLFPGCLSILLCISSCKTDPPIHLPNEVHYCGNGAALHDTVVLLVLGQSNAANAGETIYQSHCTNSSNFYDGNFYPLNDPLKGANGAGGSVWSRLADKMLESNYANTVIVVPCAIGGTKIEQWIPGGELNPLIGQTVNSLHQHGLHITHVLWHQGESNHVLYSGGLTPEQNAESYRNNFMLLVQYLRSQNVDAPIYAAMATRCGSEPDLDLQEAQRHLANDSLGIYNGPNTDLLDNSFRYDNCHFSEKGLNLHAEMWLEAIRQ